MTKKTEEKSKIVKIWTIAINVILTLFFLIGILIAASLIPLKNNYRIMSVMSGSMEPALQTGSLIVIKPVSEYKERDIITFQSSNKKNDYTTHRLIKVEDKDDQKIYITKGDANKESDTEQIARDKIIGKKLFSIPFLGYILGYIKTLPGLMIIIIVPAVIIIYEEVNKIKSEAKKMIEKRRLSKEAKNGKQSKKD